MTHESAIPLDAGMWLDDIAPPSAAAAASSLEDSLQLLQSHAGAHTTLSFDDDDDVHALFPMLNESSFDYDDAAASPAAAMASTAALHAAFPTDLSPILTALPMPRVLREDTTAPKEEPTATLAVSKKPATVVAPSPTTVGDAIPFPHDATTATTATPSISRKRRRRLRSTSLTATLAHWNEHEQNVFFSVVKPKWPLESPSTEEFAMLLLQRFDVVSGKLKATNKSSHDVESFYHSVVHGITDLLDFAAPHDIDLMNPDVIRIALGCWHKFTTDEQKRHELEQIEEASEEQNKRLAQELLQSIVRSRRQMLKAKKAATSAVDELLPPLDDPKEMESLEGLLREALEHSSLPSYLYQLAPHEADATPVVHHPLVRRKSTNDPVQVPAVETADTNLKRKRSESVELYHAFTTGTPLQSLASPSSTVADAIPPPSFVTPTLPKPTKKSKHEQLNQTPPQSARKKIYIKLRMVPRDTQTKDIVERSGCNPKVELKLSSTKRVSDVLDHMAKKWAKVRSLVDKQMTLHFFQKDCASSSPELTVAKNPRADKDTQSWSRRNHDVTCLDIWKQSGRMKNDEYIAVVSYQWCVEDLSETKSDSSLIAWMDNSTPMLDLLDETKKHIAFDDSSSKENSPFTSPIQFHDQLQPLADGVAAQVQPISKHPETRSLLTKQTLQAFSETVAFDPRVTETAESEEHLSLASLPEDALSELMEYSPNSQRLRRRRITPVLVDTSECQI